MPKAITKFVCIRKDKLVTVVYDVVEAKAHFLECREPKTAECDGCYLHNFRKMKWMGFPSSNWR